MANTHTYIQLGDLHMIAGERNEDRLAALDYVINEGRATQNLAAWLWPGDLSHSGFTIALRNQIIERVVAMAATAPVVIAKGNHDPDGDLDFLAKLWTVYPVIVMTAPDVVRVYGGAGASGQQFAIFALPYPDKSTLVGAGVPHDKLTEAAAAAFEHVFMSAADELERARVDGLPTLCIGHVNVAGSISSVGQPQIGMELEVDRTHLLRLHNTFIGLNHIHKHQQIGPAWYAGSLCRLDWGETEPKGFLKITFDALDATTAKDKSKRWLWTHQVEFKSVPVAPMWHVEGELTRDTFDWRVRKGPGGPLDQAPASWVGQDVRVRASYAQQERGVLDGAFDRVRALFAGARRFVFEPEAIPDRALRAPEVVAAVTLDDKLQAWARLTNVKWGGEIVRCAQLLHSTEDGDAVVADVAARMTALVDGTVSVPPTLAPLAAAGESITVRDLTQDEVSEWRDADAPARDLLF